MFKLVLGLILSWLLGLLPDQRTIMNYNITRSKFSSPGWCRDDLVELLGLLKQGKIKPVIAERIPLIEAMRAHELLERGSVIGKLVLVN